MPTHHWQKSSYCGEGEACLHVAATPDHVHLTESADPHETIVTTTPDAFAALLTTLKQDATAHASHGPGIEITYGDGELVSLRETSTPDTVVTTTRKKWDAFALGIQAGEFDHFTQGTQTANTTRPN
ncbi:DUF397 domain-containing protein [Streptomyces sp. TRM66268-LWL]|uniref:DUF397 domain-containing protein n=1 Tax=Streptomyces polyasparticus TaxID=2767826 RepID=A0ABR7SST9_9ACTN|nr:DUF397 domain-containing protein [Streptomyces polyasparticus]MBC9717581.1 DUF397 domain-containing protein [Streptomyces polyasparticus]